MSVPPENRMESPAAPASEHDSGSSGAQWINPNQARNPSASWHRDDQNQAHSPDPETGTPSPDKQDLGPDDTDLAPTCRCCGSPNIDWFEDSFPTGVVSPDGWAEYRTETGVRCSDCGALEDEPDYHD